MSPPSHTELFAFDNCIRKPEQKLSSLYNQNLADVVTTELVCGEASCFASQSMLHTEWLFTAAVDGKLWSGHHYLRERLSLKAALYA